MEINVSLRTPTICLNQFIFFFVIFGNFSKFLILCRSEEREQNYLMSTTSEEKDSPHTNIDENPRLSAFRRLTDRLRSTKPKTYHVNGTGTYTKVLDSGVII